MGVDERRPANLWLLCALSVIDGMDLQLLPASFRALEASLGMSPSKLAVLVICQDVALAVAGPFWGSLADNGCSRKKLLTTGAAVWGLLTMALAFVSNFYTMAVLRLLNGVCLGLLTPITQSIVAEESPFGTRGYSFGLIEFSNRAIGQVLATMAVTSFSNQPILGFEGWRMVFFSVALLSLGLSAVVYLCMEEKPRPWTPENVSLAKEFKKFISYFGISTFVVVVAQGMVGTIPGAALQFSTMYFQYMGMLDWQAAFAFSMMVLGGGFGSLLGGAIGDRLAAYSENHGRPLTAQLSVILGIPFTAALFTMHPSRDSMVASISAMTFMFGLVSSWSSTGCNRPILLQIVPAGCTASAMAWEFCLEHTSGHLIGPVAVGFISEHIYGYKALSEQVDQMPPEVRAGNAEALGRSLALSTVLPWIVCFALYSLLHCTYKNDIRPEGLLCKSSHDEGNAYMPDEDATI